MNCKYIYNGEPLSYQDLISKLVNNTDLINDIIYSKDLNIQSRIIDEIEELKRVGFRRSQDKFLEDDSNFDINGCAELKVPKGIYTTQAFIDSNIYKDRKGNNIMPVLNKEDFINRMRTVYKNQGLNDNEIESRISIIQNNWEQIAKDCRDLHKIILRINKDTRYDEIRELTKDTAFDNMRDEMSDVEREIFSKIFSSNSYTSRELNDDSKPVIIKNINFYAQLSGREEEIVGHVDYLIIKPNGSIEIYNIKGSHEFPTSWDNAKLEKYTHEAALLLRILEYNGINSTGIRYHIIPSILNYDDAHQQINKISVSEPICLTHKKGAFVISDEFTKAGVYIESNIPKININTESIDLVNKQLRAFIPQKDVKTKGITLTAEEYVDKHWSYLIQGKQSGNGYDITIDGLKYHVNSLEKGSKNKEVVELVKLHQQSLIDSLSGPLSAKNIINRLEESRSLGYPLFDNNMFLKEFFYQYFDKIVIKDSKGNNKYQYKWKIIKHPLLEEANVILFKNTDTGQLNIVTLSTLNLNEINTYKGNDNILNYHLDDMNAKDAQGRYLLKATYGNIELMRTIFLLNELLPQLGNEESTILGDIQVIGGIGTDISAQSFPMELILSNFVKARQVLNDIDPDLKINNNFEKVKFVDPVDILTKEYCAIMEESPNLLGMGFEDLKSIIIGSDVDKYIHLIDGTTTDSLASAESNEIKIQRITELINKLQTIIASTGTNLSAESINKYARDFDRIRNQNRESTYSAQLIPACCKLLEESLLTLNRLSGIVRLVEKELPSDDKYFTRPQNSSNSQVRIVGKLLTDSIHAITQKLDSEIEDFNLACLKYYKKKGYTSAQNVFIGNQASVFKHLFQDIEDNLLFKNPYDMTNGLDSDDRDFLKLVIYTINKRRIFKSDVEFPYNSYKDPNIENFINNNPDALWVPLEPASESTNWNNPKQHFENLTRNVKNYVKNPKLLFQEMYEGMIEAESIEELNRNLRDLQIYNKFKASFTEKGRFRLLSRGKDFFESNIQNLVIDFIYRDISEKELTAMLHKSKGILLYLKLAGEQDPDNLNKYEELVEQINDYLKVSVFNKSIMREDTQKLIARVQPIRKLLSTFAIALNPIGAIRDTISGLRSNLVRSATHFQTDVDPKDVLWAYQYVLKQGSNSAMTINLLDKFNSKYLISNVSRERLQDVHKTNREGITNVGNIMYWTLKKPDFLNRMVLFMAKLKHDGSEKAYSIVDDRLVYNWRLDKRFNLLVNNDLSNIEEYNKQKSLYLSLLIKFNEENPNLNLEISLNTDLPDGYTMNEIENIKLLGDTIYGSYNKSTQAKYEHMAIGSQLGVFSTWMNGIYDVYFGRKRESSFETEKVQAEDANGNKLFLDSNGNITTENTGVMYLKDIPLIVQGIFGTLGDVAKILYHTENGKWDALKSQIWGNTIQRRNIKRLLSDLIYSLLVYLLIKPFLQDEYKEHKKNTDGDDLAKNIALEWLFKGYIGSFEELNGPLPVFSYVLNNTGPASFQWANRTIEDIINLTFGDKTLGEFTFGLSALTRSVQDSYKLYQKENKISI